MRILNRIKSCDGNLYEFVRKKKEKSNDCSRSFIIIDPSRGKDEQIKVYHMDAQGMKPCEFKENGSCAARCNN
ncbi:MAG: hypothetical protein J5U17_04480 [Candidatus Methanoperedens sp.]|nr:hypothetical protein [Candidatus Methanoperedens sp.]MCE8425014.1 hypothetical protein [Candidatus Methanoperedens sp.]MCE8427238.1 hypothetical protein [Candidatus Methanoperedens sp.]